jgi:hypothetical protein
VIGLILIEQNHLYLKMLFTGIPLFRSKSDDYALFYRSRKIGSLTTVRMTSHSVRTPDRPSIIRPDNVDFRPDPPLYREASVPACNPSGRLSSSSGRRLVIDPLQIFFPSSNMGRLLQPSRRRGFPSGRATH